MLQQRWLYVAVGTIACILQAQGADKYTDENRPYEFGFNIEGEQHRHEKKDENGLIMGEFGFITADGVYHVTVYATDENGNFKILSMKNIRVRPYPTAPVKKGHSLPFPPSANPPQTQGPSPQNPSAQAPELSPAAPVASCSHCSLPTTTTKKPQLTDIAVVSQDQQNNKFGTQTPGNAISQRPQNYPGGSQNYPGGLQNNPGGEQSYPGGSQNYPGGEQNYPGGSQNNPGGEQNYPGGSQNNHGGEQSYPGGSPNYPGGEQNYPDGQQNYPSGGNGPFGAGQQYPQGGSGQNYPQQGAGVNPAQQGQPGQSDYQGQNYPQGQNDQQEYPQGGVPASGDRNPKQFTDYPNGGQGGVGPNENDRPSKPTLITAQMQIVDKNTDIYHRNPGEKDGLPDGLTKDDMSRLLYTFNYTVGFHGHHEEGYTNGAKQGYYFVTGRNGVRTRVDYVADEKGFRPKITQEVLDLLSDDVPKPETEKDEKYGLKGYEFKWLYYPVDSSSR